MVDTCLVGVDPVLMLTGPIDASHRLFERTGLSIGDMDTVEINEAFASVVLAWAKELRPDMETVNPNGGAIALGHPLGGTGAVLAHQGAPRAGAHGWPLRARHDVLRRRPRHRHDHRAAVSRGPMAIISIGQAFGEAAGADPERPAVTCGDESITRKQLDLRSNRLARAYQELGVDEGDLVTVALPNSVEFYEVCAAVWKLGATPQPVSWRLPDRERQAIVELADSRLVVGADPEAHPGRVVLPAGFEPGGDYDDGPLPDRIASTWKAPTSGGSTGQPKLILSGDPGTIDTEAPPLLVGRDGCHVVPGPLYHNAPFTSSMQGLVLRQPHRGAAEVRRREDDRRHRRATAPRSCSWCRR